jgi:hypothetical protein
MAGITTADLFRVQEAITGTVRYEVGQARDEFRTGLDEVKAAQRAQGVRSDDQARELARLEERTRASVTTAGRAIVGALTGKQKAALWSAAIAAAGVVADGLRHVATLLMTLYAKGVHP